MPELEGAGIRTAGNRGHPRAETCAWCQPVPRHRQRPLRPPSRQRPHPVPASCQATSAGDPRTAPSIALCVKTSRRSTALSRTASRARRCPGSCGEISRAMSTVACCNEASHSWHAAFVRAKAGGVRVLSGAGNYGECGPDLACYGGSSQEFTPDSFLPESQAMSLSSTWNTPRRSSGGRACSMASSFSVGSARR